VYRITAISRSIADITEHIAVEIRYFTKNAEDSAAVKAFTRKVLGDNK